MSSKYTIRMKNRPIGIVGTLGCALLFIVGIGLWCLTPWVIMLLWNALMPDLFGLPIITFWMAVGIWILFSILFKSSSSTSSK